MTIARSVTEKGFPVTSRMAPGKSFMKALDSVSPNPEIILTCLTSSGERDKPTEAFSDPNEGERESNV